MSRFVTKEGDKYIEEIESMDLCKHKINDVCCNEEYICLSYYVDTPCNSKEVCKGFEAEDGIIEVIE